MARVELRGVSRVTLCQHALYRSPSFRAPNQLVLSERTNEMGNFESVTEMAR